MAVEVVPCSGHLGCVDLRDPRYPDADGLHLTSAEWQEFAEAMKAGKYDELTEPQARGAGWCIPSSRPAWDGA